MEDSSEALSGAASSESPAEGSRHFFEKARASADASDTPFQVSAVLTPLACLTWWTLAPRCRLSPPVDARQWRISAGSRVGPAARGAPYPDERDELLAGVFIRAAQSFRVRKRRPESELAHVWDE